MSVITRLQDGAWDVLWCLNLTVMSWEFLHACFSMVSLLKTCLLVPQMRKKMLVNHPKSLKREAGPLKKRKNTQALCIALDPRQTLYPIPLGPVRLGLGAGRLKLDFWNHSTVEEKDHREGWETNTSNSWYDLKSLVNAGTLQKENPLTDVTQWHIIRTYLLTGEAEAKRRAFPLLWSQILS